MSLTPLFEKYELRRKSYEPRVHWKAKSINFIIQLLEILEHGTPNVEVYSYYDEIDHSRKNLVPFVIKKSNGGPMSNFPVNKRFSWSKAYMEKYYEPVSNA